MHSFNLYFKLKTAVNNIKRISLKSCEIPLILHNVRAGFGINGPATNTVFFTFTLRTYVLTMVNFSIKWKYKYTIWWKW